MKDKYKKFLSITLIGISISGYGQNLTKKGTDYFSYGIKISAGVSKINSPRIIIN